MSTVAFRQLSSEDLNAMVILESNAFPEHERASSEMIDYRLKHCADYCMGMFSSDDGKTTGELIGAVMATRTSSDTITEASMKFHEDNGMTVGVHSVAIRDKSQRKGYGQRLVKEYIKRQREAKQPHGTKRVAMIAHAYLVPFYLSAGMSNMGISQCRFGNEEWHDLICEL